MDCNYDNSNKVNTGLCVTAHLRVQLTVAYLKYTEVSVMGIWCTSSWHGNVYSGCWTWWHCIFGPLHCCNLAKKASTKTSSTCPIFELTNGGAQSYESSCGMYKGVVSLSVFRGNFVLAKVRLGLSVSVVQSWDVSAFRRFIYSIGSKWSVRCTEVVRFSEGLLLEVLL